MEVFLNKKSTKDITLCSVGLDLNRSVFFRFKKYALQKKYRNTYDEYFY